MGFFKKEEPKNLDLPNLPGMPELPNIPSSQNENFSSLPALPRNTAGENIGLQAIKDNVSSSEYTPSGSNFTESAQRIASSSTSSSPIFIKLDKFKEAMDKFEEIKVKVSEIESTLSKLKEIKQQEEAELSLWDKEIQVIKEKVAGIDSSLLNRI